MRLCGNYKEPNYLCFLERWTGNPGSSLDLLLDTGASYLTPLCLNFFLCKMMEVRSGMITEVLFDINLSGYRGEVRCLWKIRFGSC